MAARTVLRRARIYDGSGAPWFVADICIEGDTITSIARAGSGSGDRVIDVDGLAVAPGFIDAHSHSDIPLVADGRAPSKIHQGVTTELIGQCGSSAAPIDDGSRDQAAAWMQRMSIELDWDTMDGYMARLERQGIAVNVAALVGHGNVRRVAVGSDDRAPTPDEMDRMKGLVRQAMEAGAFGLSTGLIYPPGMFAAVDELHQLAAVLRDYGGTYYTHMRNESDGLMDSVRETIDLARAAGVPVHVSHLKAVGRPNWGTVRDALDLMDQARGQGIDITCDQYPYTASATSLASLLPAWAHDGGPGALLQRLRDAETCLRLVGELEGRREGRGWDSILVSRVASEERARYEGMNVEEIASDMNLGPPQAVIELLRLEELGVGMVAFGMAEEDVRYVLCHPLTMVGSDGSALATDGVLAGGKPHPRNFGTFARVLGKYAREEGILTMAEAVRKMTSLPAARIGLWDRGLIRPGFRADLVVFDEHVVRDVGTFTDPARYARGIHHVLVNGDAVIADAVYTGNLPGRILRRM